MLTLQVTTPAGSGKVFSKSRHTFSSMLDLILRLRPNVLLWKCFKTTDSPCLQSSSCWKDAALGRHGCDM